MKLDSFLHTCKKYYVVGSTKDPSGKEVHDICKTYPFSAKFTTTKEKNQATTEMNIFRNLSALIPVYQIIKSNGK